MYWQSELQVSSTLIVSNSDAASSDLEEEVTDGGISSLRTPRYGLSNAVKEDGDTEFIL